MPSLTLPEYRHFVDLSPPSRSSGGQTLSTPDLRAAQLTALEYLYDEYNPDSAPDSAQAHMPVQQRAQLIRALLAVRDPSVGDLPANVQDAIDSILSHNISYESLISARSIPTIDTLFPSSSPSVLPPTFPRIAFHRGDITRLSSPTLAIANACNSALLGCFQPRHVCVDNVIHAAAGPWLPADCYAIMQAQGEDEPVGRAKVTKAWSLPCGYVLHTVGPQLAQGAVPSKEEEEALGRCYTSCLDLAEELGSIDAVAFPCISTGLFAFPGALAARIALRAVHSWLSSRPSSPMSVIFTLFTPSDASHYIYALQDVFPSLPEPPRKLLPHVPREVIEWIREADAMVVRAGAGLSADAVRADLGLGLDYTSTELFRKLYPGLLQKTRMRMLYHSIGYDFPDPYVKWAFYFFHAHTTSTWGPTPVYRALHRLAHSFPSHFVLTSNADNLFYQSSFDPSLIYTPQGSYAYLQCLEPCSPDAFFPVQPYIDRAVPFLDRNTMRLPADRPDLIPSCPRCGGEVFLNVRGGNWFLETPQREQRAAYQRFIEEGKAEGKKLVLLEIGCGFNTPSVVRWPGERMAREGGGRVKLVRVNAQDASLPPDLVQGGRAVGLRLGAAEFMEALEAGGVNE